MAFLEPVTLKGAHARLEPLSQDQCDGLGEAVRDGELWKLWHTLNPTAESTKKEKNRRHGALHECRRRQPPGRDRLDLVRQACAAQRAQYAVQVAAAGARLREA